MQVVITPPRGKAKPRPALVFTPTELMPAFNDVGVVGISTSYRPDDPDCIPLPWRPDGRVPTRLTRDSAMCLNLVAFVPKSALRPIPGAFLPADSAAFVELLRRLTLMG